MLTVAYLTNQFPSAVEPYVVEEIEGLRSRGVHVVSGSVRKPAATGGVFEADSPPEIVLFPLRMVGLLQAAWLCISRWRRISDLIGRVLCRGRESPVQRVMALLHTWLGAYYAVQLEEYGVGHIHVHHGYFGSWIGMVAARLLDVGFSMTLHGSDLLLHPTYLDVKLESCRFCLTVSDYNRRYLLDSYPAVEAEKVVVSRLGVEVSEHASLLLHAEQTAGAELTLLAVGRLHAVKDHAFLVRACAQLQAGGVQFECSIAGDGRERRNLEKLIRKYGLEGRITLLGHVPREQIDSLYDRADVVVLTSSSEASRWYLWRRWRAARSCWRPPSPGFLSSLSQIRPDFYISPGRWETSWRGYSISIRSCRRAIASLGIPASFLLPTIWTGCGTQPGSKFSTTSTATRL